MDEFDRLWGALLDDTLAGVAVARVAAFDLPVGVLIHDPQFEVENAVDRAVVDPRQRWAVAAGRLHRAGDDHPVVESSRRPVVDRGLPAPDAEGGGDAVGCQRRRIVFVFQFRRLLCLLAVKTACAGYAQTADCSKELTAVHTSPVEDNRQKPTTGSKRHLTHPHSRSVDDISRDVCNNQPNRDAWYLCILRTAK